MKIFNWVHRKFYNPHGHSSAVYSRQNDELKRNVENNDASLFGFHAETQTLLGEVALVDMPPCWKEGILTIGTLGFDSVQPFCSHHQDLLQMTKQEEEEEDHNYNFEIEIEEEDENNNLGGEDETNPLVRNSHEKAEMEKKILLKDAVRKSLDENKQELIRACEVLEAEEKNKKGQRTTLADLFSADSPSGSKQTKPKPDQVIKKSNSVKKPLPNLPAKFVKKIIPRRGGDDDSRPMKNLNKLMRRMLKRKIHPDIGGKVQAKDGNVSPNNGEELSANEGVSLLQLQGAEIKA